MILEKFISFGDYFAAQFPLQKYENSYYHPCNRPTWLDLEVD